MSSVQKQEVTLQERYFAALTDVKLNTNVMIFDNYPSCCGSCAGHDLGVKYPDGNYVYFMNEQGRGLTWLDGKPWNFESAYDQSPDHPAKAVYFSHSTLAAARTLFNSFQKFGLPVEWDGTDMKCVTLNFSK